MFRLVAILAGSAALPRLQRQRGEQYHGNVRLSQVYWVFFNRSTLKKINWQAIDTLDLSAIADHHMLLSDLQK